MPAKKDKKGWTDKERHFAHEYLIDKDKTNAAIRAGYSVKTASVIGFEIYNRPHVKEWIQARLDKQMEELDISAKAILQEVALVAFQNIKGAFNPDGTLKAFIDMPEQTQRIISSIDMDELFEGTGEERQQVGFTKKLRTWDKMKALELLGKNKRLWIEKVEVSDNRPKVVRRDLTGKKKKVSE